MLRRLPLLLILPFLAGMARADQVTLKNGDRVTGKIVKKDGASLIFKSDVFGAITIPWDQITEVASDEQLFVVLPDGKEIQGKLATSEQKLVITTATAKEAVPLGETPAIRDANEQKEYERLQHPGVLQLWAGYVDFGASLARGNADTTTLTTTVKAARATRTDRTSAYFNQIYSSATADGVSSPTAQATRGGWAYDRNIHPRVFLNLFNDYENNRFADLDLRVTVGGGLGYHTIKTERTRLDLLGGGNYAYEKFSTPETRNSGEIYWGNDWTYRLSKVAALSQTFRMFNNMTETGEYRINFDIGMVTNLNTWLAWQLTYSDRYQSNPVGGLKQNDMLFTTGLRVTFTR
jgi:putative salt-induced outer membrane protein